MKKLRAILNKLTPEKFETLSGQVKELEIDNTERLCAVIDLIFEKANDEQAFSTTYARLCQVLSKMSVQGDDSNGNSLDVVFNELMVDKCREEFQKNDLGKFLVKMVSDLSKCTDPAQKQQLKMELELQEFKLRRRSVGNLKFIGELYKLNLLGMPASHLGSRGSQRKLPNYSRNHLGFLYHRQAPEEGGRRVP